MEGINVTLCVGVAAGADSGQQARVHALDRMDEHLLVATPSTLLTPSPHLHLSVSVVSDGTRNAELLLGDGVRGSGVCIGIGWLMLATGLAPSG